MNGSTFYIRLVILVIDLTKNDLSSFMQKYGDWALVAGASEGLGSAFAYSLARRGMNLVLLARRIKLLESLAADLESQFNINTRCIEVDLGDLEQLKLLPAKIEAEVGLLVYNAAYSPIGYFTDLDSQALLNIVDVNTKAPLYLTKVFGEGMIQRKRGGIILMSSLSGNQGSPKITTYAATKAFNTILAEGLWLELKEHNIDVIASIAGAIRTPGYSGASKKDAPGTLEAAEVAEETLSALSRGPVVIPGYFNKFANFIMAKLMNRKQRINIMHNNTKELK